MSHRQSTTWSRRRLLLAVLRRVAAGGSLLLAACSAPPRERFLPADTTTDPYAAVRMQADEFYRQGVEAYRLGEYRRALDNFQRAKLHDPAPRADVEEMIRRTQEAIAGSPARPPLSGTSPPVNATPAPATTLPFNSRAYNYAITYPIGWRADGAINRIGPTLLDQYTEERENGASAVVFGFPAPDGASQDGLVRQSLALRQKEGTPWKRLGVRPVDAAQAVVVTYTEQRTDGAWLAVRQAVFLRGGICWVVVVSAPLPDAQRYAGVLDQMLDGFRLNTATR